MRRASLLLVGWFILSSHSPVFAQIHHRDLASYLCPSTPDLPVVSAHRGGRFQPGLPENSLILFRHITSVVPVFIECDIQMSRDSVLFLLHDDSLQRTTTGSGLAREFTWEELQRFELVDDFNTVTTEKIPSLESVFHWAKEGAILALDIKDGVPIELLVELIRDIEVENHVLLVAYSLEEAVMLHEYAPELVMSVSMYTVEDIEAHAEAGIPFRQCVAFTGTSLQGPELYKALREKGILSILGTMHEPDHAFRDGDLDVYSALYEAGVDILATDHPIEAAEAAEALRLINVRVRGLNE